MLPFAVHSVCKNHAYEFDFEEFRDTSDNQIILAHIAVKSFSPSVLKQMRREWREIRLATPANLFAIEPSFRDTKWERFVQPFGFQYFRTIDRDGDLRRMFVSRQEAIIDEPKQERKKHVWH